MVLALLIMTLLPLVPADARAERIKDIAGFEGVRENQLIGYGLVVGLDGAGDKGLANHAGHGQHAPEIGHNVSPNDIKAKNTALVMVTAMLPAFPKPGVKMDAHVSAMGDARHFRAARFC